MALPAAMSKTTANHNSLEQDRAQREQDNGNSPLLRLPPELRNRMYEEILPAQNICKTIHRHGLLQACRFVRRETLPMCYGKAICMFDVRTVSGHQAATARLRHMSTDAMATSRRVHIETIVTCTCKIFWCYWGVMAENDQSLAKLTAWIDRDAKDGRCKCTVDHPHCYFGARPLLCTAGRTQADASKLLHDMESNTGTELLQKRALTKLLEVLRPNSIELVDALRLATNL
ncbi:hypothetical protein LTR37_013608 [Vermiconidia calcicola]|uniref:Uncharacterized protein n=1 Tax=Vermiconidia calcicola TaxID=1690605 RepID=A0ACC3MVT2_9PEZI|nr:hypothetical protein LTR37_013608 [Vermiconidia calcicola]